MKSNQWSASVEAKATAAAAALLLSDEGYSGREIADRLGYSPGMITALVDAGELMRRAGPFAREIKRDAVSLTENSNKDERQEVLGDLTGERLADAVQHYARVALDRKGAEPEDPLKAEPLSSWPLLG